MQSETEGFAHLAPRLVERLRGEGIVDLAAGYNHVAAVSDAGDVWTWGIGLHGQLGHGDLENQAVPKLIARLQVRASGADIAAGYLSIPVPRQRQRRPHNNVVFALLHSTSKGARKWTKHSL